MTSSNDSDVERLVCAHYFHAACIGNWRKRGNTTCPLCRREDPMHRLFLSAKFPSANAIETAIMALIGKCGGTSLYLKTETEEFIIFFVPESLLAVCDDALCTHHMARRKGAPASVDCGGNRRLWTIENADAETAQFSFDSKSANDDPVRQRLLKDARFKRIMMSPKQSSQAISMLYDTVAIEMRREMRGDASISARASKSLPELIASRWPTVVSSNDMPLHFQRFFCDPHARSVAQRLPRSEAMQIMGAAKHFGDHCVIAPHYPDEENTRVVIAFKRIINSVCNCCWRTDNREALLCCAACEITFYCSKECQVADWVSHCHWCCESDALPDRGPMCAIIDVDALSELI